MVYRSWLLARRRIDESRKRIAESDDAVRGTIESLGSMRESARLARIEMAQFRAALERWRTLENRAAALE